MKSSPKVILFSTKAEAVKSDKTFDDTVLAKLLDVPSSFEAPEVGGIYSTLKHAYIDSVECHCHDLVSRGQDGTFDVRGDLENRIVEAVKASQKDKSQPVNLILLGARPNSLECYLMIAKLVKNGYINIVLQLVDQIYADEQMVKQTDINSTLKFFINSMANSQINIQCDTAEYLEENITFSSENAKQMQEVMQKAFSQVERIGLTFAQVTIHLVPMQLESIEQQLLHQVDQAAQISSKGPNFVINEKLLILSKHYFVLAEDLGMDRHQSEDLISEVMEKFCKGFSKKVADESIINFFSSTFSNESPKMCYIQACNKTLLAKEFSPLPQPTEKYSPQPAF